MSVATRNEWVPFYKAGKRSTCRLLCLPHAGAGAATFRMWTDAMLPEVEVLAVEYPGRLTRIKDEPIADIPALAEAIVDGTEALLDTPFALFGFSFGSLIAFEVARVIRRRGLRQPLHLFVAACGAPHLELSRARIHELGDQEFLDELEKLYGPLPHQVRTSRALLNIAMRSLRPDVTSLERYRYRKEAPFEFGLSVFGGSEDFAASPQQLSAWQEHTTSAFSFRQFPGDHFFVHSRITQLLPLVKRCFDDVTPSSNLSGGGAEAGLQPV